MLPLRPRWELAVSAASALVLEGSLALVLADDALELEGYHLLGGARAWSVPLLARPALPEEHAARKAAKPDFEALARLPEGQLLALGSGSTAGRRRGALLARGATPEEPPRVLHEVDLAPLYLALEAQLPALNIEGAAALSGALCLLHRGTRGDDNAVVELALAEALAALRAGEPLTGAHLRAVRRVDLGRLEGVPLGFTDAAPLDPERGALAFSAAAEDTENPYDDGPCRGSVLGLLEPDGRVHSVVRVEGNAKIEGLALAREGLWMVADPDDPTVRAWLYESPWPEGWPRGDAR